MKESIKYANELGYDTSSWEYNACVNGYSDF